LNDKLGIGVWRFGVIPGSWVVTQVSLFPPGVSRHIGSSCAKVRQDAWPLAEACSRTCWTGVCSTI
jgi:hypothetical protein